MFKNITVVTILYNNSCEIENFLILLDAQKSWNESKFLELILVDNNSNDSTLSFLKKTVKKCKNLRNVRIIHNKKNIGFSRAVNMAVNISSAQFILLINPDVLLKDKKAISRLLKCLEKNDIVGGLLYKIAEESSNSLKKKKEIHGTFIRKPTFFTGLFEFTNLKKIWPNNPFFKKFYYLNENDPYKSKKVDAVSGAFMLFKKKVFDKIGGFDDRFFLYLEDIDFCLRAIKMGFSVYYCNSAIAYHYGGASSKSNIGRINYSAWKTSRRKFFKKYCQKHSYLLLNLIFYLDEFLTVMKHKILNEIIIAYN